MKVIRDVVATVRTVTTIGPVDGRALGTYGWFSGIRRRGRTDEWAAKDRRRYGTCIICRRKFDDTDPIYMVFGVARNGKTIGNRLCCTACAGEHATLRVQQEAS